MILAKIKAPNLSIKAAEKRGFFNFSSSFHYNQIMRLGDLFIEGKISLNDFLPHTTTNTRIIDATYFKREGKRVYGAKKIITSMGVMSNCRMSFSQLRTIRA